MKEINLEELKVLQMDVLTAIDKFCTENGITYSLAEGTLLGAIRHKGYIPWDDDIDIYLYRDDYNKLISTFPEVYEGHYKIASLERDKSWARPYANAYDDRTVVVEKSTEKEHIGVNIDIFPIDNVPDDEQEWQSYDIPRRRKQKFHALRLVQYSKERSFIKNITVLFTRAVTCFISKRRMAMYLDNLAQRFDNQETKYVFSNAQGIFIKKRFLRKVFDQVIDIPFEDRTFKGFADYDEYLCNAYGDYMKLPPVEMRVSHHAFKAYWK